MALLMEAIKTRASTDCTYDRETVGRGGVVLEMCYVGVIRI